MIIEYDPAKAAMPDCGGVPGSTHYQVVLLSSDGQLINQEVPREELIEKLGRLGYENHGIHREDGPLKGLPAFTGLIGPMWGGSGYIARYETARANRFLNTRSGG